ncbi:hypothetical protein [Agrobacterium vitis]
MAVNAVASRAEAGIDAFPSAGLLAAETPGRLPAVKQNTKERREIMMPHKFCFTA